MEKSATRTGKPAARRRTYKLLGLALILLSLALALPAGALASTTVAGILSSDTRWTATGSPYLLSADVQVAANVTLTIDPGVTVHEAPRV